KQSYQSCSVLCFLYNNLHPPKRTLFPYTTLFRSPEWELFDLTEDPMEMNNCYSDPAYKNVVKELKDELYRLKKELKDDDQIRVGGMEILFCYSDRVSRRSSSEEGLHQQFDTDE